MSRSDYFSSHLNERVREDPERPAVWQEDVERDGVAQEVPDVRGKEVEDGEHDAVQHVHVDADPGQPRDYLQNL